MNGGAVARSALRNGRLRAFSGGLKLQEADEVFEIVSTDDLARRTDVSAATTKDATYHALDTYLAEPPGERGSLQVVPTAGLASV